MSRYGRSNLIQLVYVINITTIPQTNKSINFGNTRGKLVEAEKQLKERTKQSDSK